MLTQSNTTAVDSFAQLLAAETDATKRKALVKRAEVKAVNDAPAEAFAGPAYLDFDTDCEPPAPDWLIVDQLERRQVAVLSADTGAAKSILSQHLAVQSVAGLDWLGCETRIDRVLYIDAENPRNTAMRRLKALGVQRGELGSRLRYFNRQGLSIGERQNGRMARGRV